MGLQAANASQASLTSVRLVIFDLGGVLVRVEPQRMFEALAQETHQPIEQIQRSVADPSLLESFELGRISPKQFFVEVSRRIGAAWTFDQFVASWNSILSEDTRTSWLLERLHERYSLLVLTNTNVLHDDHIRRSWLVFNHADHWIASCRVGLRKPDTQIYRLALRQANALPEGTVYVDDVAEHIAAARRLGVRAIHMTDGIRLEDELRAAGLSC
ncbi:MAG: HAD family phosphatase [Candidatus Omnitrophica bacterium]|nr:HAD family phosphatase [Candidatus Omnitrophota bacterium]